MASEDYCKFVDKVCELANIPEPSKMYERAAIEVDGIRFVFQEDKAGDSLTATVYCDFGRLPDGPECEQVMYRLLDLNLTNFEYGLPYFTIDNFTDHVYLAARGPVHADHATQFFEGLGMMAEQAKEWKKNYFLIAETDETAARNKKPMSLQERLMRRANII